MHSFGLEAFGDLGHVAWSFLLLGAMFVPLELAFPAHDGQRILRRGYWTDALFFLGQYLLWLGPVVAVLVVVHRNLDAMPLGSVRAAVASLPLAAQWLLVIVLCDALTYWAHRLSHANAWLWRFHRVHHTAERLDWLAAHREHPVDNLYTRLVENLPMMVLGFPIELLAGFAMFRGLWALYIHSNVSLTPGPLRYLLGASRLHHWHHDAERGGHCNFANLNPLMDLCFGTYFDPGAGVMPERYGIDETGPRSFAGQLVAPFVPDRWTGTAPLPALASGGLRDVDEHLQGAAAAGMFEGPDPVVEAVARDHERLDRDPAGGEQLDGGREGAAARADERDLVDDERREVEGDGPFGRGLEDERAARRGAGEQAGQNLGAA
jgi:sterol desaturase/sphingolipid hydroxylase (fatty acid hydroxylase superfamily)